MNYLPDEISIKLHFTDVQEIDDSLTNDEARQVLKLLADLDGAFFDKDMIESWINYFKSI
jgi:hypothetical protein